METETILIDTSILIDHLRKKNKTKTAFYYLSNHYNLSISSISEYEFAAGLNQNNFEFINLLLSKLEVFDFNSTCARIAAEIYQFLKKKNKLIPNVDILIAATAKANNLRMASHNICHFKRIEELSIVDLNNLE